MTRYDDATASHPDHDGLRARHLDHWRCDLCDALDELDALSMSSWTHRPYQYVTEATRATVRRVTGLTLTPGERWSRADVDTAATALRER